MANVKINSINEFNNSVLDLKSKVEGSLKTNITSINSTLESINNYSNNGFNVKVRDMARILENNFQDILNNMNNASKNLFNYASYINQFNVDDYNQDSEVIDLESLYNSNYLNIQTNSNAIHDNGNKTSNSKDQTGGTSTVIVGGSHSENNNSKGDITNDNLETYLDSIDGKTINVESNLQAAPIAINVKGNENNIDKNTLTIINNLNYNQENFALFQERYIISTSPDYGKVGDLIDITHSDGTTLKCIIGNIEQDASNSTINFVVNQDTFTNEITLIHPNWLKSITSVKNKGNYFDYIK